MADSDILAKILGDLLKAESAYRSAMKIYKDHPTHPTRIRAESRWDWAKSNARSVLKSRTSDSGQRTLMEDSNG